MTETKIDSYDTWLSNDGPAALTFRRQLMPVEGKNAWIFPPTFAQTEPRVRLRDTRWHGRRGRGRPLPCAAPISEPADVRISDPAE